MGAIAAEMSDYVIITDDNPRSEDPQKIALDIEVGIRRLNFTNYEIILDRTQAVAKAFGMASEGDAVLLAGKGHEEYQIIGDEKFHFSDAETARNALKCAAK
jgi:UDP-N-acetylmuramoyl-L-alanyl-D-glutamate--2,6-diaminopimelate ligase